MDMQAVKSSSVKKIGWEDNVCAVEYVGGGTYEYTPVPKTIYDTISASTSKGTSVDALLKKAVIAGKMKCKKVK